MEFSLDFVIEVIVTILLLPLQVVLIPIDALFAMIPGVGAVPESINSVVAFVGSIPSTMVNLVGLNPLIWNLFFLIFIFYIAFTPAVNTVKKVWAWVRP